MRRNLKKITLMMLVGTFALGLTACGDKSSGVAKTYSISTDDSETDSVVKIILDDDLTIEDDNPFTIKQDEEEIATGTFITQSLYEEYKEEVSAANDTTNESGETVDGYEDGTEDGNEYIKWHYTSGDSEEYNYAVYVEDTDVAIVLKSDTEDDLKTCIKSMSLENDTDTNTESEETEDETEDEE